jgi:hypothetical protein
MSFHIGPYQIGPLLIVAAVLSILIWVYIINSMYIIYALVKRNKKVIHTLIQPVMLLYGINHAWLTVGSSILIGIITYGIVTIAIQPDNSWYKILNNEYMISTIGVLMWLLGPAQIELYYRKLYKDYEISPQVYTTTKAILYLLGLGILIGTIVWVVGGLKVKNILEAVIQGFGISSLIVLLYVVGLFFVHSGLGKYLQLVGNVSGKPSHGGSSFLEPSNIVDGTIKNISNSIP